MPARKPHGVLTWLTSLFSFFFGLNSFNALVLLNLEGSDFAVRLSIFSLQLGTENVLTYFLASLIATSVFIGFTIYLLFSGLPADPNMLERLARVESSSSLNTSMLENIQIGFFKRLENSEKNTELAIKRMNTQLEESDKGRKLVLQKMNANLEQNVRKASDALESHQRLLQEAKKENEKSVQKFTRQTQDFSKVQRKIEKIRRTLIPGRARLTCRSELEAMRSVEPGLAVEMRNIGISNVGQFLTADPVAIAEKTNRPHAVVANLQSQAQLLMVPGVDEDDAELLTKVGITSRKELADQDPVELTRTIVNCMNAQTDEEIPPDRVPTVDNVWSWIRSARR